MNYLAHIFLSGNLPKRQIGNFIGDFVKGRQFENYPSEIRHGILLHRQIDSFTDSHPIVRETIGTLRGTFGRYAGIVLDLYFDHFLAIHFQQYSGNRSLAHFAIHFYGASIIHYRHLPPRVRGFIWHFISTHRLGKYATLDGLKDSLQIMAAYKTPAISPDSAINYLRENYVDLEKQFHTFFPELIEHVNRYVVRNQVKTS